MIKGLVRYLDLGITIGDDQNRERSEKILFQHVEDLLSESEVTVLEADGESVETESPQEDLENINKSRDNNPRFNTTIEETESGVEGNMTTLYAAGNNYEVLPKEHYSAFTGKTEVYVEFQADDYDQLNDMMDQAS